MDLGARILHLDFVLNPNAERERLLQCCAQRTATAQRPAAVSHTRYETQLECVGQVGASLKPSSRLHRAQQLEGRLAIAILEVLPT